MKTTPFFQPDFQWGTKTMESEDDISGFYDDDGNKINEDLIVKPDLCITCRKDGHPDEYVLCMLNRMDQQGESEFKCGAYSPK